MTDRSNEIDPAERVRQLQARRAASGRAPRTTASTASADGLEGAGAPAPRSTPAPGTAKRRRHHPAAATRWLVAGLSIASFFGIAGTVAAANVSTVAASAPTSAAASGAVASTAPAAATPASSKATSAATSTPRVTHTTTRGS